MARFRWTLLHHRPFPFDDTVTEVLDNDPIGWEEMTLRLTRDKLYQGVFTEFTLSLKWHCEGGGKEFIDNVYDTYDINGNISVLIEISCDGDDSFTELYSGKLNLASYQTDGEYTTCNIERSDLYSKLIARDEISVDLESTTSIGAENITAVEAKTLPMHSQQIFLQSDMQGDPPFTKENPHSSIAESIVFRGFITHSLTTLNAEADFFSGWGDYDDMDLNGPTTADSFLPEVFQAIDENVQYPATYTVRADFSGTFTDTASGPVSRQNSAFSLVLAYGQTLETSTKVNLFTSGGYSTILTSYSEAFDTTPTVLSVTLSYGEKVWLYWYNQETVLVGPYTGDLDYTFDYDQAQFSIEINSSTDETTAKSVLIHEAFNQVVDSIADEDLKFYSDFYGRIDSEKIRYASNGCGSLIAITNGLNIRQFENKSIFCTLKDLFNSANALHNIGLTIEEVDTIYAGTLEVVRVEPISYFFDSTTQIISLTGGVKIDTENDNSRYVNSVLIGYDKWENEFKGGLDDPNTKHEYSTKINAVKGQYNRLSKYIGSGYAIEFTRRKNSDVEKTEDWRYDNDNFFIALKYCHTGTMSFTDNGIAYLISINDWTIQNTQVGDEIIISNTTNNNGSFVVVDVLQQGEGGLIVEVAQPVINEVVIDTATACNQTNPFFTPELYVDAFDFNNGEMISILTAYNLRLTPMRMLQPHIKNISACLTKVGGQIAFVRGDGNTLLETQMINETCPESTSGINYAENDSFTWNNSDVIDVTPLWLPEIYKFEYPLTASQLATIRANPHGYISVTDDKGNIRTGYILDMEYKLSTGLTNFELLRRNA